MSVHRTHAALWMGGALCTYAVLGKFDHSRSACSVNPGLATKASRHIMVLGPTMSRTAHELEQRAEDGQDAG